MFKNKLKILIICVICLLSMLMSGYISVVTPLTSKAQVQLLETAEIIPVYRNGIRVLDGIKIGDTTYTQLRSFTNAVNKDVEINWNSRTHTATLTADGLRLTVTEGKQYMVANDRYLFIPDGAINHNGSILVPLRAMANVFGVEISWDEETSAVIINTENMQYIKSGKDFYVEDDLYWLSRLINSESGNQPLNGKIGVGNVVLNRVSDPSCPNTIYDVIFDNKYGVQFSVTENGTIHNNPNEESVIAAKLCLEGYNLVDNALYFVNPDIGVSSWFLKTRTFVATIAEHDFYA